MRAAKYPRRSTCRKLLKSMLCDISRPPFVYARPLRSFLYSLQKQQLDMVDKNKKLQKKLEEILPESIKDYEGNGEAFDGNKSTRRMKCKFEMECDDGNKEINLKSLFFPPGSCFIRNIERHFRRREQ